MRRRTFDALATLAGLVLAVVLAIGGGLLLWGHSVISTDVHNQLAAQKIVFPPATSSAIKELPAADAAAMSQYGGQLMTTGAQAQTYADHFIAVHLVKIGGGKTYSQLSAASLAQPKNTALADQVQTIFRGTDASWAAAERLRVVADGADHADLRHRGLRCRGPVPDPVRPGVLAPAPRHPGVGGSSQGGHPGQRESA